MTTSTYRRLYKARDKSGHHFIFARILFCIFSYLYEFIKFYILVLLMCIFFYLSAIVRNKDDEVPGKSLERIPREVSNIS